MDRSSFLDTISEFLDNTGMSDGNYNSYFSAGDERNLNTTIYVDEKNNVWLTDDESIVRVKTTINTDNVVEFRYSQFGADGGRFFVICNDNSGLDFCEGEIGFFKDGYYGDFKNAIQWFRDHPVE